MTAALPRRHTQNEAPDNAEKFQTIVLLVLGLAFIGAASIALGFAGGSASGVAIGAGVVLAAGGISIFNAIARTDFRSEGVFKNLISKRNSNHASHMPVAVKASAPAHNAVEAESLPPRESAAVRPRELLQPDHLTRHPFVRPNPFPPITQREFFALSDSHLEPLAPRDRTERRLYKHLAGAFYLSPKDDSA